MIPASSTTGRIILCLLIGWLSTKSINAQSGSALYDIATIKNIPWGNVHVFFRDSEGYLWYSTEEGLYRDNGYQPDVFCSNESNPQLMRSNCIYDIVEDGKGHIWFGTTMGAYVLDKNDYGIHGIAEDKTQRLPVEAIYALSDGTVWMSTGDVLLHFDPNEQLIQQIDVSKRSNGQKFVNAFYEDSQHSLWLAQSGGCMWRYDIQKQDFIPYPKVENIDPQCLLEDSIHGCYWIGTWGKGVVKYIPNMVGNNAIYEFQPATYSLDNKDIGEILDMEMDLHTELLWVTTVAGMYAYQFDEDGTLCPCAITQQLPKGKYYLRNITRDPYGNLWVSGASSHVFMLPRANEGILKYAGRWKRQIDDDSLFVTMRKKMPDLLRVVQDADGNIFYQGRQTGLCMLRQGEEQPTTLLKEFETCSCLTLLNDGTLCIGTVLGSVYTFHPHTDKAPCYVPQLSNPQGKKILDVKQDSNGHIWVLTRESVKEWDRESDNCRSLLCNHPMIHMDHFSTLNVTQGDSVCVGEEESYCILTSTRFQDFAQSDAKARVSTVIIDNKIEYIGQDRQTLDVDCHANVVELRLTTLRHHLSSQVQFAYRLLKKGFWGDSMGDWVELPVGNNTIVLTSLRKGDYTVEVRATNGQGIWGQPVKVILLHRLPAWWETWWAYTLYAACLAALAFWVLRWYSLYVRSKRMTQMEEQLTELKFRFFTNISHELRTPLTLILVPVEQMLAGKKALSERDQMRLESIQRNALELQQLVNQLLDFRRMEIGVQTLSPRHADISGFILAAVDAFHPLAQRKGITLSYEHPNEPIYATFDHEKMHHIIWNLLSNAMKFTPEGGYVKVLLKGPENGDNRMSVHVIDSGVGIPPVDLPHIFDRYYQAENSKSHGGSGIGLHMVRELVRLHGGEVGVESQLGKGSDFWFVMPLICQGGATADENHGAPEPKNENIDAIGEIARDQTTDSILLVEDNLEMRTLIADQLRDEGYHVVEASDGKQGWQLLSEIDNICLVISDVMMPVMDGFELCRHIKSSEQTSHIPVILLTAKTSEESKLEGYKMGADCYLTKPFSPAVLLNRIKHLQEQRASIQQKYQHDEEHEVAQLTYSPIDEELITRAQRVVESHLADKDYNVEQFSNDMCTSRMTLYRKINSITGQSPSEFITTVRLKHAAKLLRTTSLTTQHIAELTGFSSPSYFTKNFKKMFGKLPKDYRTQG